MTDEVRLSEVDRHLLESIRDVLKDIRRSLNAGAEEEAFERRRAREERLARARS